MLGEGTKDIIFAGLVVTSFIFSYFFNKYNYPLSPQEKLIRDFQKYSLNKSYKKESYSSSSLNQNFDISKSLIKESIKINMEKIEDKHKNDFSQKELDDLNLSTLRIVKNDLDFNNNWFNMRMDNVVQKIENLHPNDISETSSNSWQLYIFIKLLNNYPNIIKFFDSNNIEHRLILELLQLFKINAGFSPNILTESQKYEFFTKFILKKQTDGSISLLLKVLKNYHQTTLRF